MKEERKPIGWPENIPLPTKEAAGEAIRTGEQMIVEMLNELKDKVSGLTPEMLKTQITI